MGAAASVTSLENLKSEELGELVGVTFIRIKHICFLHFLI